MNRDSEGGDALWSLTSEAPPRSLFLAVVDHRPLVCTGLARLARRGLRCRVAVCADLDRADVEVRRSVVSLDVLVTGLPPQQQPQTFLACARTLGAPVVLALDCGQDAGRIPAALAAQADGYLLLELTDQEGLARTVASVLEGRGAVPPELHGCSSRTDSVVGHLTPRCLEVLRALADGLHDEEVAVQLGISVSAVRKHIHTAEERLHASTRTHLVANVARMGLLPTREGAAESRAAPSCAAVIRNAPAVDPVASIGYR